MNATTYFRVAILLFVLVAVVT